MNKFRTIELIRETIYDLLEQSQEYSEGDKVVTVDGENGDITLAKHPFYAVTLDDTGITKSYHISDLKGLDGDKDDNKYYGKYDVDPKDSIKESPQEKIIVFEGILTVDEKKSQLTDILSSIRSLSGITVVRNDEIDNQTNDIRSFKTKLVIKVDPYPFLKQNVHVNNIKGILISAIKKIKGVKGFLYIK